MKEYPAIDAIYTMRLVDFGATGNTVTIKSPALHHVYDETGAYLGTTADRLPVRSKYCHADGKLESFDPQKAAK